MAGIDVLAIRPDGVERCEVNDVEALLDQPETIVWVDIPTVDAEATQLLREMLGIRPLAVHTAVRFRSATYTRGSFSSCCTRRIRGEGGHVHLVDWFRSAGTLADGEMAYLQRVIEFFQTQINTKMYEPMTLVMPTTNREAGGFPSTVL
jgi:hypothetical protein